MKLSNRKQTAELWYNGKIPAYLFFEILTSQDLTLLKKDKGYAKERDLKSAWAKIYDEYFTLKGDPKMALIVKTQADIITMARTIEVVRQTVYAICTVKFDDTQLVGLIAKVRELGFDFDEKNPLDSCLSILKEQIPSYETRIEIEKDNLEMLTKGVASTFEENCVAYEGWGFKIDENCSLRRYVAYEKSVLKKASKENGKRKAN